LGHGHKVQRLSLQTDSYYDKSTVCLVHCSFLLPHVRSVSELIGREVVIEGGEGSGGGDDVIEVRV
jgi:hypothetical protein